MPGFFDTPQRADAVSLPPPDIGEDFYSFLASDTRPIVVYGMGNGADKLINAIAQVGRKAADFFASDGFVRGQAFHGKRVLSFAEVREKYPACIVLVSFGSRLPEVAENIAAVGKVYPLYIPELPLAGEGLFTASFYRQNYDKIASAYALLADDISRTVYAAMLYYRLTALPAWLSLATYCADEAALLGLAGVRHAVDAGAYRGDTVRSLADVAPALSDVVALEPDGKNYKKLEAFAQALPFALEPHNAAAWGQDGVSAFFSSANRNATLFATGEKASFKNKVETCRTAKIDTILCGRNVDYIKFDVEGAEAEAICGASDTILRCTPAMLISAYHKSEDIFSLPLLVNRLAKGRYRYYYRRRPCFPGWELNLLCCPVHE